MGSWAEGPLESDTALDFCYLLETKPVTELIKEGLASDNYDEIRTAAWLLEQLYAVFPIQERTKVASLANKRLTEILEDEDWIGRWRDQEAILKAVAAQVVFFGSALGKEHQRSRELLERQSATN